jgi:polyribonucleotide nucleotidyltransferase
MASYWFEPQTVALEVGGRTMTLETGRMAKQAAGAVVVTYGETVVLVTAARAAPRPGIDFFPLVVDFVEKTSAAGKIPGGFFKREGRLSDREILVCRFIDRSIRPLFPEQYRDETQIMATVLSADGENAPDMPAFVGASAALSISALPFEGPIAAVRLGRVENEFIVNPTREQSEESDLDLVVGASRGALVMVEGGAGVVPEAEMLDALKFGHSEVVKLIDLQEELVRKAGVPKMVIPEAPDVSDVAAKVRAKAEARLDAAVQIRAKNERYDAIAEIEKEVRNEFVDAYRNEKASLDTLADVEERREGLAKLSGQVKRVLHDLRSELMRKRIVKEQVRIDGRGPADIRPIACEVRVVPRPHGAALFTRGETQALVTTTLGTGQDEQIIDALEGDYREYFMLHYNFPPYSVGEAKRMIPPGRREVGHGKLAWRAVRPVLPNKEDFPYTIRVVSEITESNGSSSMATVCGSSLALMDAGVPLSRPIAGIAMGLIKEDDDFAVLSDILGDEDHLGDMDFKVAGTDQGVTSLQMDIKITSITAEIMRIALDQAREGRLHILNEMAKALTSAREGVSENAPRITVITIPREKIREVIGTGGKVIREITETTGAKIDIEDDGTIKVAAVDQDQAQQAIDWIKSITAEPEVGEIYSGKVVKVVDFGAFVNFMGPRDGLVHISELAPHRVKTVGEIVQEGDTVKVKCIGIDDRGKVKLSMKAVDQATGQDLQAAAG